MPYALTLSAAAFIMICVFFGVAPEALETLDKWFILSTAVVCCMGLVNLSSVHARNVRRKGKDWDLSIVLLVITYGYLALGVFTNPTAELYSEIFQATAEPLGATFYSVLAFYIVSAAYRAFRAKTRDAAILLITGVIVLLGNAHRRSHPPGIRLSDLVDHEYSQHLCTRAVIRLTIGRYRHQSVLRHRSALCIGWRIGGGDVSIWERLSNLDRRVYYVVLLVVVALPVIQPWGLPIRTGKTAEDFYNAI